MAQRAAARRAQAATANGRRHGGRWRRHRRHRTGGRGGNAGAVGRGGTGGAVGGTGGAAGRGGTARRGRRHDGHRRHGRDRLATIVPGFDGYYWEVTPSGNTALSGTNYPFGRGRRRLSYRRDLGHDRLHRHQAGADRRRNGRHQVHGQHQRPRRRGHALLHGRHRGHHGGGGRDRPEQHLVRRRSAVQRQHLEHAGASRRAADHAANDGSVQRRLRHLLHELLPTRRPGVRKRRPTRPGSTRASR